jgi:hypothetical protein
VLEHIAPTDVPLAVSELSRVASSWIFAFVSARREYVREFNKAIAQRGQVPAAGNLHLTTENVKFWLAAFARHGFVARVKSPSGIVLQRRAAAGGDRSGACNDLARAWQQHHNCSQHQFFAQQRGVRARAEQAHLKLRCLKATWKTLHKCGVLDYWDLSVVWRARARRKGEEGVRAALIRTPRSNAGTDAVHDKDSPPSTRNWTAPPPLPRVLRLYFYTSTGRVTAGNAVLYQAFGWQGCCEPPPTTMHAIARDESSFGRLTFITTSRLLLFSFAFIDA